MTRSWGNPRDGVSDLPDVEGYEYRRHFTDTKRDDYLRAVMLSGATLAATYCDLEGGYPGTGDPYHRGGDEDTGYGIRGKPALGLIRQGFDRIRAATGATPAP